MKRLLEEIIELLEIPRSYYEKAEDRYHSLADWFHRPESSIKDFNPDVYPQGSFRYGTVIRPLLDNEEYDLDLVCQLELPKTELTQEQFKNLVGNEVKSYATGNSLKEPAREKPRCWRLEYQDEVNFHMDILPAVPDDQEFKALLIGKGVPRAFADEAIAITDIKHPRYSTVIGDWPKSNPRGFAAWFEERMMAAALDRRRQLVANRTYASVEEVPTYEWKTSLQHAIQILKRHRDIMFRSEPEKKPISMIITTLSSHAYQEERDIDDALENIVHRMPRFVQDGKPRVPNPVDPAEDFADKWSKDPELEKNFWVWHKQVQIDLGNLGGPSSAAELEKLVKRRFGVDVAPSVAAQLAASTGGAVAGAVVSKPATVIRSAPKPWNS